METTQTIKSTWSNYDKLVAQTHLNNYGIIFLDDFKCPIDDIDETNYLYSVYKSKGEK